MDRTELVLASCKAGHESEDSLMCLDKSAGAVNYANVMDIPTLPGVWRRIGKESCWESYPPNVAESIFLAFCGGESFVEWVDSTANAKKRKRDANDCRSCCSASTHRVDFETMKEVELSTGMETNISIVQATISAINYTPTEEPIETGVWWEDDSGTWHCYTEKAVNDIQKAWRRRDHFVSLKKMVTPRFPRGIKYIINLIEMVQLNPVSGKKRPVKIISNSSMPTEVLASGGGCNLTIFSLGMDLLRGSLQRLLSIGYINSTVSKMVLMPHGIVAIQPSKCIKDNDHHLLYQKFKLAYETVVRRVPGCCGQLMRLRAYAQDSKEASSFMSSSCAHGAALGTRTKPIFQHVFYSAPAAEVDKIFETGLQGCEHIDDKFFAFSTDYYDLRHSSDKTWDSRSTHRLLLFLIIALPSPHSKAAHSAGLENVNAIPVASVEHHLPIALLTLKNTTHAAAEPELLAIESGGRSGVTDCNRDYPIDSQVLSSATARHPAGRESGWISMSTPRSVIVLPSKSKDDIFLVFKLYCPKSEQLRHVGRLIVQARGRPTEILGWMQEVAGLAPDAEIRLYKENSSNCIHLNSVYAESELEDGCVVVYNKVLAGTERKNYRCPDFPTFKEHVRNRQTVRFRRVTSPTFDDFCLELSSQDTLSDVTDKVAQHVVEDASRVLLYFNDCFLQQPKPLPMDGSASSALLGDAYQNSSSILYYKILDRHLPELDGSKTLTIAFHGGKGARKLSVHEVELPKRSFVKQLVEKLRGMIKELCNSADAEIRIFEVRSHRISKIHPANERIGYISGSRDGRSTLRAMEIREEERDVGPKDRLIQVRHFHCPQDSRKCQFFGEPFLMVVREHETLAHFKDRILKEKVQMAEKEFARCKFALLSGRRREYLDGDDILASRMRTFSLGFYDPLLHFLGLDHVFDSSKSHSRRREGQAANNSRRLKRRHKHADGNHLPAKRTSEPEITPDSSQAKSDSLTSPDSSRTCYYANHNQDSVMRNSDTLVRAGQADPTQTPTSSRGLEVTSLDDRRPDVIQDRGLEHQLEGVVETTSLSGGNTKCNPPEPMSLAICQPMSQPVAGPDRDVSHITVPDPEFHNFDSPRTEKDVLPGQVWAIYDNHDGMPRYYGLILHVSLSPFKVELLWLEPQTKKRWWVETTGVSIACGEYEISTVPEIERQIGVFSHVVLQKVVLSAKGLVEVFPRKGEVWAIFSNWDVLHMLGPKPILTPNGVFNQHYEYDMLQMLDDYSADNGVPAVRLVKTKGFKTVFHPEEGPQRIKTFLPVDLRKFSHAVPAEKMDGFKDISLPPGAVELDPASLAVELMAAQ